MFIIINIIESLVVQMGDDASKEDPNASGAAAGAGAGGAAAAGGS